MTTDEPEASRIVVIDYTDHWGQRSARRIRPFVGSGMYFGSTRHHPDEQWLLEAVDVGEAVERTFAMKDIHSWTPENTA